MKKDRNDGSPLPRGLSQKMLLRMRLTTLLLCCLFVQSFATASAQSITLKMRNASLEEVIWVLKEKTKLTFLYTDEDVASVKGIDLDVKDLDVDAVLEECLAGTGLDFVKTNDAVIIRKAEPSAAAPQQEMRKVTGKVTDTEGTPLPGVTVVIAGTTLGTATDVDGNYSLECPEVENLTLIFSFVGMESQEVLIGNRNEVNVVMKSEATEMDEVVVTGIFNKSKESYTGAVSIITEKELKSFRGKNLISTLNNIDPTFNILENNLYGSDPNHLPELQIRGTSSLPTVEDLQNETKVDLNTPLIILDGFEISLTRMLDLNDEDVASVTLLKDGSATAIYGSRGANGVVVIETKRPEPGKLRLSYRGSLNLEVPDLTGYNVLNAAEKLQLEYNAGLYEDEWAHFEMELRERYAKIQEEIARGVDTYWLSKPLRTGVGQRHNLRLEGGGDGGFRYAASVQYNNVVGVMKGSNRETFNGNVDLMYQHKKLLFRNNLEISLSEANESPYGTFDQYVKLNPYWTGYDEDGKVLKELEERSYFWNVAPENPLYNASLALVNRTTTTTITNNFDVEWRPLEELTVRSRIGLSKQFNDYDNFKPADHTDFKDYSDDEIFRKGRYVYSSGKGFNYDWDITISYAKTFAEKHELYVGLNYNLAQEKSNSYTFTVEGFPQDNLKYLSMALQYEKDGKPSGVESVDRRIGVTGNVNYIFDNRYFADVAYRVDGASQFGSSKRFAPFYSFGLGWNIHEEQFMERLEWLDRLKFRVSYAVTGSVNFDPYQALATYKYYVDDRYRYWFGSYMMGLANEDLEWQKTDKWNFGLEMGLLNNRLRLTLDIYNNMTNNLLSEKYLPLANGFPSYTANIGKVKNSGVEMSMSAYIIRNTENDIFWSVSASMIHEKNEIVEISEALKAANEELEAMGGSDPNYMYREGEALRTIYVVPSLGVDPSTGKELFRDRYGNITYNWDPLDKVACGSEDPKYRGNINTMFAYQNWSLNLSFGYRMGGYQYNNTLVDRVENADYKYNVDDRVYNDRWTTPGDHTFFKNLNDRTTTQMSSRFVQKENTFECQSVQLKYDFNQQWIKKYLCAEALSLAFDTNNLFRCSTIKQERGIMYPFSRQFTFSLSATF